MQINCWLLRCSWSIACRRKDSCKPRRETFKLLDLVRLILEILRYMSKCNLFLCTHRPRHHGSFKWSTAIANTTRLKPECRTNDTVTPTNCLIALKWIFSRGVMRWVIRLCICFRWIRLLKSITFHDIFQQIRSSHLRPLLDNWARCVWPGWYLVNYRGVRAQWIQSSHWVLGPVPIY